MTSRMFTIFFCRSTSRFGTMTACRRSETGSPGCALQPHDTDFFDPRTLQVVALDLVGIDVFAGAKDDDFLLATGDEEIAASVGVAKIAGVQPAVANDLGGSLGAVVIALHDDWAVNRNFADHVTGAVFRGFGVDNLGFVTGQRLSDRTDHVRVRRRDQCSARSLGQSISLQNVEAKSVKITTDRKSKREPPVTR